MTEASTPLRVVQISAPAAVGGLETVVRSLSTGLVERGHQVTAISVIEPGTDIDSFVEPMSAAGVNSVVIEVGARSYLDERRQVHGLLAQIGPDVLHTHGYRPDVLHGLHALRSGIRTVSTVHGYSKMGGLSNISEWLQKRALRRFDAVISVSAPLASLLQDFGIPRDRLHIIPNALAVTERASGRSGAQRALGLDRNLGPVLGWVGRLVPIKGGDVFLEALAHLTGSEWTACIIGDGPERPSLEEQARRLGITERVAFVGEIDNASEAMADFDMVVLSSRSEGTPMVLLEAMSMGIPVIATSVGGIPDVVQDGIDGRLVPSESPEALAAAIGAFLVDPEAARTLGEQGRERLRRDFSHSAWLERHEKLYVTAAGRV